MKYFNYELLRFIIVGVLNTAFTYIVYLFALRLFGYIIAFTISFVTGVVFAFFMYSLFVFKTKMSLKKFIQYPLIYLIQYFLAMVLLIVFVEFVGFDKNIAPLINVVILTPFTFVINRWFLSPKAR